MGRLQEDVDYLRQEQKELKLALYVAVFGKKADASERASAKVHSYRPEDEPRIQIVTKCLFNAGLDSAFVQVKMEYDPVDLRGYHVDSVNVETDPNRWSLAFQKKHAEAKLAKINQEEAEQKKFLAEQAARHAAEAKASAKVAKELAKKPKC